MCQPNRTYLYHFKGGQNNPNDWGVIPKNDTYSEMFSPKSLLMITLGLFSLARIGYNQTKYLQRIFQKVQWKTMNAVNFYDVQNCSCEINSEGRPMDTSSTHCERWTNVRSLFDDELLRI